MIITKKLKYLKKKLRLYKTNKKKLLFVFLLYLFSAGILILIVSGCAKTRPSTNPLLDKKAFHIANQARSSNQHIIASKGTGWIRLETKNKKERYKIAWAAVFPDKIRISFLLSGNLLETIIATGKKITFISHLKNHADYSYNSKDPNMKDFIKVPVKMSEIISILSGRFPIKNFNDAYFVPSDPSLSTIVIKQNKNKQYLHFNSKKKLDWLELTNYAEKLLYKITIIKYKTYDFGDIPVKIEIKDTKNRRLVLEITNFLPNPLIKDSVFRLTGSG